MAITLFHDRRVFPQELVFDGGSYPVAGMFEKIANGVPIAVLPLSFLDADMDADTVWTDQLDL